MVLSSRSMALAVFIALGLISSLATATPSDAQQSPVFTIVVLPDTQNYTNRDFADRTRFFADQVDWVIAERDRRNIVFASHVGDVVQRSEDATEWGRATPILDRLQASGIPFAVAAGNHDIRTDATGPTWDQTLPASRFAAESWYGGDFENNRNSYQTVTVGSEQLLFVHVRYLRFGSITGTLNWVDEVLAAHPNHMAFVTAHEFGGSDGNVVSGARPLRDVLAQSCNVVAVFAGHIHDQARGTFTDTCGRSVPHLLSNYQHWENGGQGFLREYRIDPATMTLAATTYSPTLNGHVNNGDNSFSVALTRPISQQGTPVTAIAQGSPWRYFDQGAPPVGWTQTEFDDHSWELGTGEFGFGDGDETTTTNRSLANGQRISATYFRSSFVIDGTTSAGTIDLLADDGAVVWLNGQRVVSDNMGAGAVDYNTRARSGRWGSAERAVRTFALPASAFVNGVNTVAVEVHQSELASSDLSFDATVSVTTNGTVSAAPVEPEVVPGEPTVITAVNAGAEWRYFDRGATSPDWALAGFDDAGWASGSAELGFGDGDERTPIANRVNGRGLHTAYFRHEFTLGAGASVQSATLELVADDGAVVWVNGERLVNDNITTGPVGYTTLALSGRWGSSENAVRVFDLATSPFRAGTNVIAVEVHQNFEWSSDLSFDAELELTLVG